MKKNSRKQILAAVLFVLALNSASALPNIDPFADASANGGTAYTVGLGLAPNISTNNDGSTNNWALVATNAVQPTIVTGNLTYPGLPASTGNSVSNFPPSSGSGASARLGLNVSAGPTITYYSLILKVTDISAVPASPAVNAVAAFSDTTGPQAAAISRLGGRLVTMTSGSGYVL